MKRNVCLLSVATLAGMMFFTSCLKDNNDSGSTPKAGVSVLMASPDAPPMDLYFNQTKIAGGLVYNQNGFTSSDVGNYTISFVNTSTGDTLNQVSDSLSPAYYSLIMYDTASKRKALLIQDQFEQSQNTDAVIRFLQLSPGADVVNVYQGTTKLFDQRTFADNVQDASQSKFKPIAQGTYSFYAVTDGGDTLGSIKDVPLTSNAYTLYLSGLPNHTDSLGVKLRIMTNY